MIKEEIPNIDPNYLIEHETSRNDGYKTNIIRDLVVKFNLNYEVANQLIGKTEKETALNVIKFVEENDLVEDTNTYRTSIIYGYTYDKSGKIIEDPYEQRVLHGIFYAYENGITISNIIRLLHKNNIPTKRRRNVWYSSVIRRMIDNKRNV